MKLSLPELTVSALQSMRYIIGGGGGDQPCIIGNPLADGASVTTVGGSLLTRFKEFSLLPGIRITLNPVNPLDIRN